MSSVMTSNPVPPPPPPAVKKDTWGSIWRWVRRSNPLTIMGIKFYIETPQAGPWGNLAPVYMVEIPVRMVTPDNGLHQEIPIYDLASPVRMAKSYEDWVRKFFYMEEPLAKAEMEHKKQWEADRARQRRAIKDWEKKYPEAAAKLLEDKQTTKKVKQTQAVMDFVVPLTKARSAIESMLLAIDRGTYNGQMCSDLYYAMDKVSRAQRIFRRKCCASKKTK